MENRSRFRMERKRTMMRICTAKYLNLLLLLNPSRNLTPNQPPNFDPNLDLDPGLDLETHSRKP